MQGGARGTQAAMPATKVFSPDLCEKSGIRGRLLLEPSIPRGIPVLVGRFKGVGVNGKWAYSALAVICVGGGAQVLP